MMNTLLGVMQATTIVVIRLSLEQEGTCYIVIKLSECKVCGLLQEFDEMLAMMQ